MASAEFNIFLSHNSHDKTEVLKLSHQLKDLGFEPWVDAWNLVPGGAGVRGADWFWSAAGERGGRVDTFGGTGTSDVGLRADRRS